MDTSSFRSWADYVVRIRHNQNGEANMDANRVLLDPQFGNNSAAGHALTQQMKDEIAALMAAPAYDNWPYPTVKVYDPYGHLERAGKPGPFYQ